MDQEMASRVQIAKHDSLGALLLSQEDQESEVVNQESLQAIREQQKAGRRVLHQQNRSKTDAI